MRSFILALGALILSSVSFAQNHYTACGEQSGSWSYDTVFVSCDVTVPNGQQLTIEPGTTVLFEGYFSLHVQGSLLALGSADQPILFSKTDTTGFANFHTTEGGWNGLRFEQTPATNDSSVFENCLFYFGKAAGDSINGYGGALRIDNFSKIRISHSGFYNNYAFHRGGAIYANKAHIRMNDVVFENNFAGNDGMYYGYGGGFCFMASNPYLFKINGYHNASTGVGGAAAFEESNPRFVNGHFQYNYSALGGAIGFLRSEPDRCIANLVVEDNSSMFFGGGIACLTASPQLTNLTIINNSSAMGGGYYCNEYAFPVMTNSIIWNNIAGDTLGSQVWIWDVNSEPTFKYCNIQGGTEWFGGSTFHGVYENNLNADPMMEGIDLTVNSPCWNAGTPDTSGMQLPAIDFHGVMRIIGGRIDMGATELLTASNDAMAETKSLVQVYPNPVNNQSVCTFTLNEPSLVSLCLYQLDGRKASKQLVLSPGVGNHRIALADLVGGKQPKTGLYLLQIVINGKAETHKILF